MKALEIGKTILTALFGLALCVAVGALVALPPTLLFLWGFGAMFEWVWSPDHEAWRWVVFGVYTTVVTVFSVVGLLRVGRESETTEAMIQRAVDQAAKEREQGKQGE